MTPPAPPLYSLDFAITFYYIMHTVTYIDTIHVIDGVMPSQMPQGGIVHADATIVSDEHTTRPQAQFHYTNTVPHTSYSVWINAMPHTPPPVKGIYYSTPAPAGLIEGATRQNSVILG